MNKKTIKITLSLIGILMVSEPSYGFDPGKEDPGWWPQSGEPGYVPPYMPAAHQPHSSPSTSTQGSTSASSGHTSSNSQAVNPITGNGLITGNTGTGR